MRKISSLFILPMALGSVACLATAVHANQPMISAEVSAQVCPTDWAILESIAPGEVDVYEPFPLHPSWGGDVAEAMGRFHLLAQVIAADTGAIMAIASVTSSDETWTSAEQEHDVGYEWTRGRARTSLLDCLITATRSDRDLLGQGVHAAFPEMGGELEEQFELIDRYECNLRASRQIFALDYEEAGLAASARDIFETIFVTCLR